MERWIRPLPARWAVVLGSGLLLLSLGLASYRVWAEEKEKTETPTKKAEQQPAANKPETTPIKREDLYYGGKDFYQWRRELLTELKPAIRADGMKAFAAFGTHGYGPEATQAILEMMRSYDPAIEHTNDEDMPVVQASYNAIRKIGAPAVSALTAAVKDQNQNVRRFAITALGRMVSDAKPALPTLIQACKSDDRITRELAIDVAGRIGEGSSEVIAVLTEALNEKHESTRLKAVISLWYLRESAKPAVPALLKRLSDKEPEIRIRTIEALRTIGAGVKAVPAMSRLLRDENINVRTEAYRFLNSLGPDAKDAVPALIEELKTSNKRPRLMAIETLGRIGPGAKEAVPALDELLRSDDDDLRKIAIRALKRISPDDKR
jgi:HEAT repeat protein